MTRMIQYFSCWFRLRESVAWMLRFKSWLVSLCQKRKQLKMVLTQSDLNVVQKQCLLKRDMETFKREQTPSHLSVEELENAEL